MRPLILYRIASVLFVIFALGHTIGFLSFTPPTSAGLAVRDAMNNVQFRLSGANLSYGHFYLGFGLYISVYLFFSAFLAWRLGSLSAKLPQAIGALGWIFFAVQLAGVALACVCFAAPQIIFSSLVAACLGSAIWQVRQSDLKVH